MSDPDRPRSESIQAMHHAFASLILDRRTAGDTSVLENPATLFQDIEADFHREKDELNFERARLAEREILLSDKEALLKDMEDDLKELRTVLDARIIEVEERAGLCEGRAAKLDEEYARMKVERAGPGKKVGECLTVLEGKHEELMAYIRELENALGWKKRGIEALRRRGQDGAVDESDESDESNT